ncbi:MAG: zf-HC2 domain-containing protein [Candidatus Lindowbacteria bacterium]|nr:zf-HC2 domain-containing protein [Candidatus Lindowbacteria bacterium]
MTSNNKEICNGIDVLMGAVLSDDCTSNEKVELKRHLLTCPDCRDVFEDLASFRKDLLVAYIDQADRDAQNNKVVPISSRFGFRGKLGPLIGLAAAAALVIAVVCPSRGPNVVSIPNDADPVVLEVVSVEIMDEEASSNLVEAQETYEIAFVMEPEVDFMAEDQLLDLLSEEELEQLIEDFDQESEESEDV